MSDNRFTPEMFTAKIKEDCWDEQEDHKKMDKLMMRCLRENGFGEGVEVLDSIERWYA